MYSTVEGEDGSFLSRAEYRDGDATKDKSCKDVKNDIVNLDTKHNNIIIQDIIGQSGGQIDKRNGYYAVGVNEQKVGGGERVIRMSSVADLIVHYKGWSGGYL